MAIIVCSLSPAKRWVNKSPYRALQPTLQTILVDSKKGRYLSKFGNKRDVWDFSEKLR